MYKRLIYFLLSVILLTACNSTSKVNNPSDTIVSPDNSAEKPEITILYYADDGSILKNSIFPRYIRDFKKQYGVEVTLQGIGDGSGSQRDMENFQKKINTYLHTKKGPELIMTSNRCKNMVETLLQQDVVVNLRGKVANIDKIYEGLLDKEVYYVPIGMDHNNSQFNKIVLEELGITALGSEWTAKDYEQLIEKWRKHSPRYFTSNDFYSISSKYLWKCKLYDEQSKQALLNTPEVKAAIRNIRKEIYENYKLDKNYIYENYYKMLFEPTSEEAKKDEELLNSREYREQGLNVHGYGPIQSRLFARQIQEALDLGLILKPEYKDSRISLDSFGFLVNKNGANVEIAYEFINGLLSDEKQLGMWEPINVYQYYPVNKDIEEEIKKAELQEGASARAMEAKEVALNYIKQSRADLYVLMNIDNNASQIRAKLYDRLQKELVKFIFADVPYSDEKLTAELKRMEAEYNVWLNE